MTDNSENQIKIRKMQNLLIIIGNGVMLFSLWTILKTLGEMLGTKNEIIEYIKKTTGDEMNGINENLYFGLFVVIIMIFITIGVLIRVYIGRSAIAQAKGKKKSIVYLVLTLIVFVSESYSAIFTAIKVFNGTNETGLAIEDVSLASVFVALTSAIMLMEMFVTAIRLRRHQRSEKKNAA